MFIQIRWTNSRLESNYFNNL